MGAMSSDHLLLTPEPVGLEEVVSALGDPEVPMTLRMDSSATFALLVRQDSDEPVMWISPSRRIADRDEVARLLVGRTVPDDGNLTFWTEVLGRTGGEAAALVPRLAQSLATAMRGWTTPLTADESES